MSRCLGGQLFRPPQQGPSWQETQRAGETSLFGKHTGCQITGSWPSWCHTFISLWSQTEGVTPFSCFSASGNFWAFPDILKLSCVPHCQLILMNLQGGTFSSSQNKSSTSAQYGQWWSDEGFCDSTRGHRLPSISKWNQKLCVYGNLTGLSAAWTTTVLYVRK